VKNADPNRSRVLVVMLAFAIFLLVAMAVQHARMRAGQVPSRTTPASQR